MGYKGRVLWPDSRKNGLWTLQSKNCHFNGSQRWGNAHCSAISHNMYHRKRVRTEVEMRYDKKIMHHWWLLSMLKHKSDCKRNWQDWIMHWQWKRLKLASGELGCIESNAPKMEATKKRFPDCMTCVLKSSNPHRESSLVSACAVIVMDQWSQDRGCSAQEAECKEGWLAEESKNTTLQESQCTENIWRQQELNLWSSELNHNFA